MGDNCLGDICECCCETLITICSETAQDFCDEQFDKAALAEMKKGIPLEGCPDDTKYITILKERYGEDLPICFPDNIDIPTKNGSAVKVWYLVTTQGIHRISVNRTMTGFFPTRYCVDGTLVASVSVIGNERKVLYNTTPEVIEMYNASHFTHRNSQFTVSINIDGIPVKIVSQGGSTLKEVFCLFIFREPSTLRLYVGDPATNVSKPSQKYNNNPGCCLKLLILLVTCPCWFLWSLLAVFFYIFKMCICCCYKGPVSRRLVQTDSAGTTWIASPMPRSMHA